MQFWDIASVVALTRVTRNPLVTKPHKTEGINQLRQGSSTGGPGPLGGPQSYYRGAAKLHSDDLSGKMSENTHEHESNINRKNNVYTNKQKH